MIGFKEYLAESERLNEGFIRSAALLGWSNKSKVDGDRAVAAFRRGQEALRRGSNEQTADARLKRVEGSLEALFDGLTSLRQQIGSTVALNLTGHLLSSQTGQQLLKKK